MGKSCKWYAGALPGSGGGIDIAQRFKTACLTYTPTSSRHPEGWRYAVGPYRTKATLVKTLRIPGASVQIDGAFGRHGGRKRR